MGRLQPTQAQHLFGALESGDPKKVPHGTKQITCDASLSCEVAVKLGLREYRGEIFEALEEIPARAIHGMHRWALEEPDKSERLSMVLGWAANQKQRMAKQQPTGTPRSGKRAS